jgi:hypothetical protein
MSPWQPSLCRSNAAVLESRQFRILMMNSAAIGPSSSWELDLWGRHTPVHLGGARPVQCAMQVSQDVLRCTDCLLTCHRSRRPSLIL